MPSYNISKDQLNMPFHHIGIFVGGIEKMSRFYTGKLGFLRERDFSIDKETILKIFGINSCADIRCLTLKKFRIELIHFPEIKLISRKERAPGVNHWALLVKNKDFFCKSLRKKKVKVIKAKRPHGFVYVIKDPEDNLIEIKNYQI